VSGVWAVVPVKELTGAKQRLSSCLSPEERRALATIMLEDVLDAVSAVRELAGVLVVTVDPVATSLAVRYGARIVTEGARDGHTGAVTAAARLLTREGQAGMMTMPGDIPLLKSAEIAAPRPPSPSCRRMTISDRTRSSVRRRTPFRCVSAKTASIRISTRRESVESTRSSSAILGSGWILIIPSISSPS
jgi:2-phospho-L-lactate guanylyltransferase (CobY/MobA/RfbA family)